MAQYTRMNERLRRCGCGETIWFFKDGRTWIPVTHENGNDHRRTCSQLGQLGRKTAKQRRVRMPWELE